MTYDAFLEQMKKDLEFDFATELLDKYSGVKIGIRDVEKLQGESYGGISFKDGNSPVEGNMNMQMAYEAHEAGRSFADILHETEQAIMQQVDRMPQFDLGVMSDYRAMKPKLMTELIHQKGNEARLSDAPHEKIEDLALIYRIDLGERNGGRMTTVITDQMMEQFGITQEQLHQDAVENAAILHPASLRSMREVMASMMGMEPDPPMPGEPELMVATTKEAYMGAAVIQYPGFMDMAAEKMGGDFFVLPSSIHEVLLLPDDGKTDYDDSDLGYYYVEEAGIYDTKSMGALARYIDYEAFGRDVRLEEGGTYSDAGYVRDDNSSWDYEFDGTHEGIPEEYLLFVNDEDSIIFSEREKETILKAMEAAGYSFDQIEVRMTICGSFQRAER